MSALLIEINRIAAGGLAALLNTLWYAAAVVGLTWVILCCLHRVNAATRYWIWTAVLASLMVLPFLPGLVKQARAALAERSYAMTATAPLAKIPVPQVKARDLAPITLTLDTSRESNPWPLWLLAIWMFAAAWQLARLARGVASVRRLKARAQPMLRDALPARLRRRVQLLTSAEIASPVAVGYRHPAVVVPPELLAQLEDGEKRDVLLHEMAHLARYDDWMALATHAVAALLILHPLAAIAMRQIEREREIACDDFVVAQTGSARSYARSLARLHDLRWSTGTRLLAAGILGRNSSLGNRIESLLRRSRKFSARPSLASLGVSALLLAALLGAGGLIPGWLAIAQTKVTSWPSFEVVSIRPHRPSGRSIRRIMDHPNDGRFYATGVTVKVLIENAYHTEDAQVVGGPSWIDSERFDIQAKADSTTDAELQKLGLDQAMLVKRRMVQELLADRFGLKLHHETKDLRVYALMVAKHGLKIQEVSKPGPVRGEVGGPPTPKTSPAQRYPGGATIFSSYQSMPLFAQMLSRFLGVTVLDRTGLTGHYRFELSWMPGPGERFAMGGPNSASAVEASGQTPPSGPSIFTALQEQLGLKLKLEKGTVDVAVIDHIEPPTPN